MIENLWPTSFATAALEKEELVAAADWWRADPADLREDSRIQEAIADRLLSRLTECVGVAAGAPDRRLVRFDILDGGAFQGIQYAGGQHALVWVALLEGPEVGQIVLYDPRAGAAMVAMPGMPWGGSRALPMNDGLALVLPGWLGWSVQAIGPKTRYLIACVSVG